MADQVTTEAEDSKKLFAEWDRSADEQVLWMALAVIVVGLIVVFGAPLVGDLIEAVGL